MSVANAVRVAATMFAACIGVIIVPMPMQAQQKIVNPQNPIVRDEADRLLDVGQDQLEAGKPREAIKTWLYAISYYRQINDQSAISFTLARVSDAYEMMGATKAAQETMQKRIGFGKTLDDQGAVIQEANNLASIAISQGELESASALSKKALQTSQKYEQKLGEATALNNQGLIAGRYGYHLQALKLYYAAVKERPLRDPLGNGYTYINSGDSLMALDNYKSAITDYGLALTIARQYRNYKLMSIATDRLIAAYLEVPNFYRIEELLQNRSSLALVQNDRETAAIVQRYLGDLYLSFGNLPKARAAYQESYEFAAILEDTSSLPLREAYFKLQALEKL
ncbi:MAG: hypothetical protein DCE90_09405 [Pseudanabaena sp.]|nr:MAG: hypothetical protein DCE90_09405 [Pseudanabaena sp.]